MSLSFFKKLIRSRLPLPPVDLSGSSHPSKILIQCLLTWEHANMTTGLSMFHKATSSMLHVTNNLDFLFPRKISLSYSPLDISIFDLQQPTDLIYRFIKLTSLGVIFNAGITLMNEKFF